jgi:hypothetical protein
MAMIHAIMGEDTKVLTKDEQLQNFFAEQYKTLIANAEQQSWDTGYRMELDAVKKSPEMEEARKLPLRTKIRRRTSLQREGVLVFARKGKDFVFKIAETGNTPQDITPEEALSLLKTNSEEKPFEVSQNFENVYEEVKKSLFAANTESENEKTQRNALDKIRVMIKTPKCDTEYLTDLKSAVEFDTVSGDKLRVINRLKPAEYGDLPKKISKDYIRKMLNTYDSVLQGVETLILTEEIESDAVEKEKDLFNAATLKTE